MNATESADPPKAKRQGKTLTVWLDAEVRDALDRLCKKHRRKIKDEVAIALEEYAANHGELPPAD